MKLRVEDLQVSSFVPGDDGEDLQIAANTLVVATCRIGGCQSQGGQLCATQQYGGGETCETGPYYYC